MISNTTIRPYSGIEVLMGLEVIECCQIQDSNADAILLVDIIERMTDSLYVIHSVGDSFWDSLLTTYTGTGDREDPYQFMHGKLYEMLTEIDSVIDINNRIFKQIQSRHVASVSRLGSNVAKVYTHYLGCNIPDTSNRDIPANEYKRIQEIGRTMPIDEAPILADMLEDIGCTDRPLLSSLRKELIVVNSIPLL